VERKTVPLTGIKTADLAEGEFEGFASTFGNVDHQGDRVMPGAFTKSIAKGRVVPLLWMHRSDDPRSFVGEVVEATEVPEGLKIRGRFDVDNEHGAAAYRQVKSRRIDALSIGYAINVATKGSDGANELRDLDLIEVSVVTRGANVRALITAAKSADQRETLRERVARAQLQAKEHPMSFYNPTDPTNELDRALMKAGARENVKAAEGGRFTAERDEHLTKAREICELAKELDRDLSPSEADQVQTHLKAAEEAGKAIGEAQRSAEILAKLDAMAKAAPFVANGGDGGGNAGESEDARRLAFTKDMARKVATKVLGTGAGTKALAPSGTAVVAQEFAADPIPLGRPVNSLLRILPVKQHDQPEFAYLRQNTRTNNAAIVAEGGVKPTSPIGTARVADNLDVVAHLSEGIPRFWFADNDSLQQFVAEELLYGLEVKVEGLTLAAIAGTSGIQTNAYATSPLVTLRKSLTKLEANGYDPAAFVVHPNDWELVELAVSSTNAIEHMGIPYDPVARRLYGVAVVSTNAATEGVAHTLAQGAAGIDTDTQGVQVAWSETSNSDDWSKNLIRARVEGRYATSVFKPLGVVRSDLTAA
jgi:HK97 family phage prohead protease/HK97 family phage major capsid protein